jgi:PST family polysaccharide transporter
MSRVEKSFLKGTLILSVAALITKFLGAVYKVPYQNITGNEGMYVYQQVYPLYSVLLALATAGFPIVISKMVSEKIAEGNPVGARQVLYISFVLLGGIGGVFFLFLYFGAEELARLMGNEQMLTLPIQAVSFALLVMPFLSAIRGYFQGHQDMLPSAISQVIEQLVRVVTILSLAWYCMKFHLGVVYAGAGAAFGATVGGIVSLFVFLVFWKKKKVVENISTQGKQPVGSIARRLILLSLPICLGALAVPLYSLVDSFTVANLLVSSKFSLEEAINLKGIYDRGQPLIQFASFFATALSLSIVPAIVEARTLGEQEKVTKKAEFALKLTWLTGLPASVGLSVIAMPTNVMLFEDPLGSDTLAILAFTTLFSTLCLTSTGILQGLGKVTLPAVNMLIGVGTKWLLNWLLVPYWGINGAAVSSVISFALSAGLNLYALSKWKIRSFSSFKELGKMLLITSLMTVVTWLVVHALLLLPISVLDRMFMMLVCLVAVLVGMISYVWGLFRFELLTYEDLLVVPKWKQKILPFFEKWGWLRRSK